MKETVQDVLNEMRAWTGDGRFDDYADRIEAAMVGDTALAERVLDLLGDTYIEARALIDAQQAKGECDV